MNQTIAYWLMFFFGSVFGACVIVALAAVLAQDGGAGWQPRPGRRAS